MLVPIGAQVRKVLSEERYEGSGDPDFSAAMKSRWRENGRIELRSGSRLLPDGITFVPGASVPVTLQSRRSGWRMATISP